MTGLVRKVKDSLMQFIDRHPRTGWYITLVVTLNFLFNIAQALGHHA